MNLDGQSQFSIMLFRRKETAFYSMGENSRFFRFSWVQGGIRRDPDLNEAEGRAKPSGEDDEKGTRKQEGASQDHPSAEAFQFAIEKE